MAKGAEHRRSCQHFLLPEIHLTVGKFRSIVPLSLSPGLEPLVPDASPWTRLGARGQVQAWRLAPRLAFFYSALFPGLSGPTLVLTDAPCGRLAVPKVPISWCRRPHYGTFLARDECLLPFRRF